MTRPERTQLGWIVFTCCYCAFSGNSRWMGFRWMLRWYLLFALACLTAGAVLEIIHLVTA